MAEPIIEALNVVKTYHSREVEVRALRGIDLVVDRGEMVAVMGPSGSGKTTLLNCLSSLDVIDSGDVTINGHKLERMSDDALSEYRARTMGFVFQAYNLLPVLSARENVEMPLILAGASQGEATRRAKAMLDNVGLADRYDHLPAELSGGQQQRVAIARALANDPAIVWADEPTGNLDSVNAQEIMDLLCRLNEENDQTFVIVTHDEDVGARAGRIIRMLDGQIEDDGRSSSSGAAPQSAGAEG